MEKRKKRKVQIAVISDTHLGTYGCRAKELLSYLKSISPETLIINGDFIDIWQFRKSYWPKKHMQVIKYIMGLIAKGVNVYYITGNHDEMLRKFTGFELGTFKITNKVLLEIDGKQAWFFHGDVFDVSMKNAKWLAKLGGLGYDILIMFNNLINWILERLGQERISFSKRIKNSVKEAVKFIDDFEQTAADIAIESGFDYVVCGHIHQPANRVVKNEKGEVRYLNSGDWIENLTALEYADKKWELVSFEDVLVYEPEPDLNVDDIVARTNSELFQDLVAEFNLSTLSATNS